jgi:phage terminase large subunit-like protein
MVLEADERQLLCAPRWSTPRDYAYESDGERLAKVARLMGFELFAWQRLVADVGLERKGDGYRYRTVGCAVGRQSGKSKLIETRIAYELLQPSRHVAYTAQDRNMAKLKWEEHIHSLESSPALAKYIRKVSRNNGSERLYMKNGSMYSIVTPNDKGARGMSLNLMVIDEALTHPLSLVAALQPTLATRKNGQLWILSNAGIPGESELLQHYRNIGHTGVQDDNNPLAWFEWAPAEDKFDYMDEAVWRQAIPSLGESHGVLLEAVREAALTNSPDIFMKEWLNVWISSEAAQVVATELWDSLARTDIVVGNRMVLGVDISRERDRASIGVSSLVSGMTPVEVVEARDGVGWLVPRLIEIAKKWKAPVVIDAGSPAGSIIGQLENAGVKVIAIGLRDYARACGSFYDAVQERTICHLDDPNLRDAIIGSSKRPLGDSWAWNRQSTTNITPLVAVTLARYGLVNEPEEKPVVRSQIF